MNSDLDARGMIVKAIFEESYLKFDYVDAKGNVSKGRRLLPLEFNVTESSDSMIDGIDPDAPEGRSKHRKFLLSRVSNMKFA